MNTKRCLKIAARVSTLLEKDIGVAVDTTRMLTERLYMRDVLLVCDAHPGTELAQLAIWFRKSAAEATDDLAPPSGFGLDSGFPSSGFGSSGFDAPPAPPRRHGNPVAVMPSRAAQPAAWFSPARWLN